jgi:GH18 family chitinase
LHAVTDIIYFGLNLNLDGTLQTKSSPTTNELGWHHLTNRNSFNQLRRQYPDKKYHLVIKPIQSQDIVPFLESESARDQALITINQLVDTYDVQGINLDYEPDIPIASMAAIFTSWVADINQSLKARTSPVELTLDIYASAATRPNLWDLESLSPHVDAFIVMAYDYARAQDSVTGPVAPLYSPHSTQKSITHHLQAISVMVPLEQIILGIPLYGYRWPADNPTPLMSVSPRTGSLATLRHLELLARQESWLTASLSPYSISKPRLPPSSITKTRSPFHINRVWPAAPVLAALPSGRLAMKIAKVMP